MRTFKLQAQDEHWWSLNDYGAVVDAMARMVAAGRSVDRVLEFGPGYSTRSLIEGGARHIDSCEDRPEWAAVHERRLAQVFPTEEFPTTVAIHPYVWGEPLAVPVVDAQTYDLGFIDGPHGTDRRPTVLAYVMDRCASVLMPTEDRNPRLKAAIIRITEARGWSIDIRQTGELSGGFALLTRDGGRTC